MAWHNGVSMATHQTSAAERLSADPLSLTEACTFVRQYKGSNGFLLSLQSALSRWGRLTPRQAEAALKFMRNGRPGGAVQEVQSSTFNKRYPGSIEIGTFTIVGPGGGHRTLRISKPRDTERWGTDTLVVSYLNGSDNEGDYTGVATIKPAMMDDGATEGFELVYWRRFADPSIPDVKAAIRYLLCSRDKLGEYGRQYAVKSGKCWRCNRKLTTPESVYAGIGPECAAKVGVQWGDLPKPTPSPARTYREIFGTD